MTSSAKSPEHPACDSVPWSRGANAPRQALPALATDCHHHIYEARFRIATDAVWRPPPASVADYRRLQARLGLARNVLVQPSTYGVDNGGLLDVLAQFGTQVARGVAVIDATTDGALLHRMHDAGVRAVRANLVANGDMLNATSIMILAHRCADMGWHLELNLQVDQIVQAGALWSRLPCAVVFDHMGHIPQPDGVSHPAFHVIAGLMRDGKAWVKLTAPYNDSRIGRPAYPDSGAVAAAFIDSAPSRVVWGSDWPHPTEATGNKPNDADLLDLLVDWSGTAATLERILVDNPAVLYQFD